MLGWLETVCSLYMNRTFQIHVIWMCGYRGDRKRNIPISGTGVLIHTVGSPLWGWYPNCSVLDKTWVLRLGHWKSTIIKEKHSQTNEAFNFQEPNQTRKPPQYITSPGWPTSPQGQSHSKWQQVHLSAFPSRNRLPKAETSALGKSLGIIKVPCSPFNQILLLCWHKRAARHSTWETYML